MGNGVPLTVERKAAFLAELARHGIASRAARAASPHSSTGCLSTFKDARLSDGEFAEAWAEAMETARADIEHEIYRRAQEGVAEPIFGGRYKEEVVGTRIVYSDRLLELRARALLPEYRDAAAINVNKRVVHDLPAGALGEAISVMAGRLADAYRQPKPLLIDAVPADDA